MIDSIAIRLLAVKNRILDAGIVRKKRELFTSKAVEIKHLVERIDTEESFHILLHSHYDPAWFARRSVTRKMLGPFYRKVVKLMDHNPEYKFTADSQTQVLEDILTNFKGKRQRIFSEKISNYISAGRLVAGPYYAGIDLNLSSSAVLRRNIQFGMADAEKLGWEGPYTGWMIDQFGFPAQMWQLHKKFGIDSIILWRGLGLRPDEAKSEVWLESPDGTRMLGKWLFVQGYRFGLYVGKYSDIGVPRLVQESGKINKYTVSRNLLIMDGYEGEDSPDNPEKVMRTMRDLGGDINMSTPGMFMSELLKDVEDKDLPVVRGYQNFGYYSPVLKGVVSARQYIKQAHQLCDDTLVKVAEPMAVLAGHFNVRQDRRELENLWRNHIRMASHDELGGCGIDDVHRDSFAVYRDIYLRSMDMVNGNLLSLAKAVDTGFGEDGIPLILFNTLPFERTDTVTVQIELPEDWKYFSVSDRNGSRYEFQVIKISRGSEGKNRVNLILRFDEANKLLPFGYKTLYFSNKNVTVNEEEPEMSVGKKWMENSRIRVDFNDNGTFDLKYKGSGKVYRSLGYLRVEPDGGDTYDFSHIRNHEVITSQDEKAEIILEHEGSLEVVYRITYRIMVPSSITDDRLSWSEKKFPLDVSLVVKMHKDSPRLDLNVFLNNTLKDCRIRICFPVETDAEEVFVNRQFDVSRTPVAGTGLSVEEKRDIHKHMSGMISSGMDVVDVKTNINFKWIDVPVVSDGESLIEESIGIINRDNFEFEIRGEREKEKVVEFTLLRSVGWNARADLLTRNINAGWEIYTPDAFCYGGYQFSFSILPHDGNWEKGNLQKEADKKDITVLSVEAGRHGGPLPVEYSLFSVDTETIVVSEITDGSGGSGRMVFVLYNPGERAAGIAFKFNSVVKSAFLADLDGKPVGNVVSGGRNEFGISLKKKEILELCVDLEGASEMIPENSDRTDKPDYMLLDKQLGLRMKPYVDSEEVRNERLRWKKCRRVYRKSLSGMSRKTQLTNLDDFIAKYREEEAVINQENTVKEAHYSYLLTLKRYFETKDRSMSAAGVEKKIAKMARALIDLRVKKREAEIYRIFFENLKNIS